MYSCCSSRAAGDSVSSLFGKTFRNKCVFLAISCGANAPFNCRVSRLASTSVTLIAPLRVAS